MTDPNNGREMRREFMRGQLRRLSALWPLNPSPEALDEYMRALYGYTDIEVAEGFDQVIDTHALPSAPKPADVRTATAAVAKWRRRIPPTEFEREELGLRQREIREEQAEVARLTHWLEQTPEAQSRYEETMNDLLEAWPREKHDLGRRILHAAALVQAHRALGSPLVLVPEHVG
jgi:hypothetical protein